MLQASLSDEKMKVVLNLKLPGVVENSTEKVIAALTIHAHRQLNVVMELQTFNNRFQHDGETFDNYWSEKIYPKPVIFVMYAMIPWFKTESQMG